MSQLWTAKEVEGLWRRKWEDTCIKSVLNCVRTQCQRTELHLPHKPPGCWNSKGQLSLQGVWLDTTGGAGACTRNASRNAKLKPELEYIYIFFNEEMKQQKLVEVLMFLLKSPVSISATEMSHVPKKWQVWLLFMVNKFTHGSKAEMEQPGFGHNWICNWQQLSFPLCHVGSCRTRCCTCPCWITPGQIKIAWKGK